MGGISIWQLLIIVVIVVLLFGTKSSVLWGPIRVPPLKVSRKPWAMTSRKTPLLRMLISRRNPFLTSKAT